MTEYIVSESKYSEVTDYMGVKHSLNHYEKREEIVRCMDCRHYMDYEHEYEPNLGYCREHDREEVRDSWFCHWAKRRDA